MYYSYTGNTRALAGELAKKRGADLSEIRVLTRPNKLSAYTAGCLAAMRQKGAKTEPMPLHLDEYDRFILMGPVWAGHPAPPLNNAIAALPQGKEVELIMVSASGASTGKEKAIDKVQKQGCTVVRYTDMKK